PKVFPEAPSYHRTSVAIHALAAVAFFFLSRRLLARAFARPPPERARPGLGFAAFVAAAFFALHPLRVESVAWVTERRDGLCGLFYVLAGWAWLAHADRVREARSSLPKLAAIAASSIAAALLAERALDLSNPKVLALAPNGGALLAGSALLLLVGS